MKALKSALQPPLKDHYRIYLAISEPPSTSPYGLWKPETGNPHNCRCSIWLETTDSRTAGIELEARRSKFSGRGPWETVMRSRGQLHDSNIIGLLLIGRMSSVEALESIASRMRRDVARPLSDGWDANAWVYNVLEYAAGKGWARYYDWPSFGRLVDGLVEAWRCAQVQRMQQVSAGAMPAESPRLMPTAVKEKVGIFRYRWRITGSVAED